MQDGIRYVAPNDDGLRGFVEARDARSGRRLWQQTVFRRSLDPALEEDVQAVFIVRLRIAGHDVVVEDERGRRYAVDRTTHVVRAAHRRDGA